MKSLQDALYNWLTIKVVCDARPDDTAAREHVIFLMRLLTDEHHFSNIEVTTDEMMYYVSYQQGEKQKDAVSSGIN